MRLVGERVAVLIHWRGFTTAADGLVACRTPLADAENGILAWNLTHAPTGRTVGYFDGPEQAQAAAARLAEFDWLSIGEDDPPPTWSRDALACIDDIGGERYATPKGRLWNAGVAS